MPHPAQPGEKETFPVIEIETFGPASAKLFSTNDHPGNQCTTLSLSVPVRQAAVRP